MPDTEFVCTLCGVVTRNHHVEMGEKHTVIERLKEPLVVEPEFTPNIQQEQSDLAPPMSAKEFKQHCARISKDASKGMATRMAAFGLGTLTEMFLDAAGEILGTPKKRLSKGKKK